MSGHWPYIIAAYTICFVLFALDWFASVFELKNLKRDAIMRQRRDENRPTVNNTQALGDHPGKQSNIGNLDSTNE